MKSVSTVWPHTLRGTLLAYEKSLNCPVMLTASLATSSHVMLSVNYPLTEQYTISDDIYGFHITNCSGWSTFKPDGLPITLICIHSDQLPKLSLQELLSFIQQVFSPTLFDDDIDGLSLDIIYDVFIDDDVPRDAYTFTGIDLEAYFVIVQEKISYIFHSGQI